LSTKPADIYVFEDDVAYHIWYDLEHNGVTGNKVVRVAGIPDVPIDPAYFLPRGFEGITQTDAVSLTAPNLWIAYRSPEYDENKQPLRTFLELGYRVVLKETAPARRESAILVLLQK